MKKIIIFCLLISLIGCNKTINNGKFEKTIKTKKILNEEYIKQLDLKTNLYQHLFIYDTLTNNDCFVTNCTYKTLIGTDDKLSELFKTDINNTFIYSSFNKSIYQYDKFILGDKLGLDNFDIIDVYKEKNIVFLKDDNYDLIETKKIEENEFLIINLIPKEYIIKDNMIYAIQYEETLPLIDYQLGMFVIYRINLETNEIKKINELGSLKYMHYLFGDLKIINIEDKLYFNYYDDLFLLDDNDDLIMIENSLITDEDYISYFVSNKEYSYVLSAKDNQTLNLNIFDNNLKLIEKISFPKIEETYSLFDELKLWGMKENALYVKDNKIYIGINIYNNSLEEMMINKKQFITTYEYDLETKQIKTILEITNIEPLGAINKFLK